MSIPGTRKSWYIMPIFPAFALLVGNYLSEYILKKEKRKFLFAGWVTFIFFIIMVIIISTPLQIKSRGSNDLRKMAPLIKKVVTLNKKINCFGMEFWSANNSFLFYTDRMLKEPINDFDSLIMVMKKEDEYCLSRIKDYLYHFKDKRDEFPVVIGGKEYVFFTNKKTFRKLSDYNFIDF